MPERNCAAGDLTSAELGTRVRVAVESGAVVEDVLNDIRYSYEHQGQTSKQDSPQPLVWLRFANVRPTPMDFAASGEGWFAVSPSSQATLVP